MLTTVTTTSMDPGLASQLRVSIMRIGRRLRREGTNESLTVSQVAALASLERHGVMTLGELAAHERVQPPSMTRIVGHLEQAGLVTRTAHPTDGRQVLLTPTDKGSGLLAADRERREAWLCQRLKTLTEEERAALRVAAEILERLARS
jgi:DNA-binding MarR family transcriptional regulator